MVNLGQAGQALLGIIVLLVVVGGLLLIFFSRTNAVEKTGYGALIMLALVSVMIPIFWIQEGSNQAAAAQEQKSVAIQRGMQTYAQYCTDQCYSIVDNKVQNPTYNGYTFSDLQAMSDLDLQRVIDSGTYNPKASYQPASLQSVPRRDTYGGALLSNDVDYLMAFIRNPNDSNGLPALPSYLQANYATQYDEAVSLGKNGQFGTPVDMTSQNDITIEIDDPGQNGVTCSSQTGCFSKTNITVKVGTKITWINKAHLSHTVTAIQGSNLSSPQPAKDIFDSGQGKSSNLLATGQSYTWTVTDAAYNADPTNHRVDYYCEIHPDMLAQLVITQ
jgi:plastocyanin